MAPRIELHEMNHEMREWSCPVPLYRGGDRRRPAVELGFPAMRFSQINSRSVCGGVFGKECPKNFRVLMECGGGMAVLQFSGEGGNVAAVAVPGGEMGGGGGVRN
ncbi:unnamed protein product [Lactuca virosa]|uniref:Uncharacterized protein n=1 Tax=Lactuca virosa TaxID=75947 RepID=A0AAU9PR20_9ASTR|nr:unnamed protein product [Lactuca virosa]